MNNKAINELAFVEYEELSSGISEGVIHLGLWPR